MAGSSNVWRNRVGLLIIFVASVSAINPQRRGNKIVNPRRINNFAAAPLVSSRSTQQPSAHSIQSKQLDKNEEALSQFWWNPHMSPLRENKNDDVTTWTEAPHYAAVNDNESPQEPPSAEPPKGNYFWQQPGHPMANYQGNDCPAGFRCINYRSCANGVETSIIAGFDQLKPSEQELMEYGRPCGSLSDATVCCQQKPDCSDSYHNQNEETAEIPETEQQQPHAPYYHHDQQQQHPPSIPTRFIHPYLNEEAFPYPGCAASLKCVVEEHCNINGIITSTPVFFTPHQKQHRIALMSCWNTDTNQVGYCCRYPSLDKDHTSLSSDYNKHSGNLIRRSGLRYRPTTSSTQKKRRKNVVKT